MSYGIYLAALFLILQGGLLAVRGQGALSGCKRGVILHGRKIRDETARCRSKLRERDWFKRRREERVDKEIYESISFLRNMTALGRGRNVSADFIIEQLSQREGVLQKVYLKMLSFLRVNRKEEAARIFAEEAATPMGREFGSLLLQWDGMDPTALTEILVSHQKSIKEVRATVQKRRDEVISDLVYLPVVTNVVVIFINFIYVAYFMEQQALLEMLF